MNKKFFKKALGIFCTMLVAVGILSGCIATEPKETSSLSDAAASVELGEGEKELCVEVVSADGVKTTFAVHTNDATVGKALMNVGLIDGEQGPYGLYVKTVNGTTYDYDKDNMYWAFYIDGEYATKGVDDTETDEKCIYSFRAEK